MTALQFYKAVTVDKSNLLDRLLKLLMDNGIRYCVIGGGAVSAYAEPLVSLDFDIIITSYQLGRFESLCASVFHLKRSPRLIEITAPPSRLRVNIHTDPRLAEFVERAEIRNVFDLNLPVARVEDVLSATIWASEDMTRPNWKQLKDLSDIARLLQVNPKLRAQVPASILNNLRRTGV